MRSIGKTFSQFCFGLFLGVFFDVFVQCTAEAGSADVAAGDGSAAVWQAVGECGTAIEALVVRRSCAAARAWKGDVAVRTTFLRAFTVRREGRKRGSALQAVFREIFDF